MWPLLTPKVSELAEVVSFNSPNSARLRVAIAQSYIRFSTILWVAESRIYGMLAYPSAYLSKRLSCKIMIIRTEGRNLGHLGMV